MSTRRQFLQAGPALLTAAGLADADQNFPPSDRIRIATIGFGGMGMGDTKYALAIPGVELVAVCDIYDGRLIRSCPRGARGWGLHDTRLSRSARPQRHRCGDHCHTGPLACDALDRRDGGGQGCLLREADGAVGWRRKAVIAAQERTGRIFQVGSQYVTSAVYQKAREFVQSGAIGRLTMVEAWLDRNTALGAWQYSVPPDASPATVDWDRFLGTAPKRPFEAIRLFRWRNYQDYGTGVAGDLFVHLLSGLHHTTGSTGPERILATGGLRYWEDGRDVPDVMFAMLDYGKQASHPSFTMSLRVNLKSGVPDERFGFRFMGTEGVITTSMSSLLLEKAPLEREPGYSISTFPKAIQEEFLRQYRQKYPTGNQRDTKIEPERFAPPSGYDAHQEHHRVFYEAVRSRKKPVEDAVFGFRAAGPALLANASYFEKRICHWDPNSMTVRA